MSTIMPPAPISSDALRQVTALAQALKGKMEEIAIKSAELAELTKEKTRLEREEIPTLMQELEISMFKLETGETVEIAEDMTVGIPVERREEAFVWLEDHGFGGLIKTEVSVAFGKGEMEKALKLLENLTQEQGYSAELTRNIHWQTLKAFCKEQLGEAKGLPMEMFGVLPFKTTKMKPPKKVK